MNDTQRTGGAFPLALLSFLLGVASLFLLIFTGLPAMFLGWQSLRAINAAEGPGRGRGLAIGGMVLGLLGTLLTIVGIVAYAVLQARAKANMQVCQNNMRVIGEAVGPYEAAHGHYPTGTIRNPGLTRPEERLSWMVSVLPDNIASKFDRSLGWEDPANAAGVNTTVRWYLCPSYPHSQGGQQPAVTDYLGLGGIGVDSPGLPLRLADRTLDPDVGFFGYDREINDEDLERGASNTVMAAETELDNGAWAAGGRSTVRGIDTTDKPYIGAGRQFGGLHRGGAFFLYADGSAVFFSDRMDAEPLEKLVKLAQD
jgi:hypothetical protein